EAGSHRIGSCSEAGNQAAFRGSRRLQTKSGGGMTGGLRETASLMAIATLLCVGATVFGAKPAKAADLGGDCCADLEERVAELEATTARKGNKKVSVQIYGKVNTPRCGGTTAASRTSTPSTTTT